MVSISENVFSLSFELATIKWDFCRSYSAAEALLLKTNFFCTLSIVRLNLSKSSVAYAGADKSQQEAYSKILLSVWVTSIFRSRLCQHSILHSIVGSEVWIFSRCYMINSFLKQLHKYFKKSESIASTKDPNKEITRKKIRNPPYLFYSRIPPIIAWIRSMVRVIFTIRKSQEQRHRDPQAVFLPTAVFRFSSWAESTRFSLSPSERPERVLHDLSVSFLQASQSK